MGECPQRLLTTSLCLHRPGVQEYEHRQPDSEDFVGLGVQNDSHSMELINGEKKITVVAASGGRGLAGKRYKGFPGVLKMCSQYLLRDMEYTAVGICQNLPNGTLEFCAYHCICIFYSPLRTPSHCFRKERTRERERDISVKEKHQLVTFSYMP